MKQHKILEDMGFAREDLSDNLCAPNDPRESAWAEEEAIYGFDSRQTWNMDTAFVQWLLERLVMYKDVCNVDLKYHRAEFDGKEITQEEAINMMISECQRYLNAKVSNWDEQDDAWDKLTRLWHDWGMAMWW